MTIFRCELLVRLDCVARELDVRLPSVERDAYGESPATMQFLEYDEYDRDHTMFNGIVGLNILLSVGLFVVALIIVATGWP